MLFLALSFISHSKAQTIDYVTGNLINFSGSPTSTTSNWNNGVYVNGLTCWHPDEPGNCGPYPNVQTNGNINFSYGRIDLNQVINVANAVAGANGPVNVTGFNFSFRAKNGNGWDDARVDQLNAYVQLYGPNRSLLENYNYDLNRKFDWTNFSYTEKFATPHPVSSVVTAQAGFIGKDNNGWAGPYGPEITNVSFSLKYSVNPCATNPGYMPSCPGFNNVITSSNLVPNPGAAASWGNGINNSFAIQTALQNSGSGLIVHGFDYGYRVNATTSYCEAEFIICWSWHNGGSVRVNAGITNAKGQTIYSASRNYNESGYSNENFHFRFPMSTNQMLLGNFNFTASTNGDAWVGNMYSRMVYSQDPCVSNPNYSPSCINKVPATYTAPSITGSSTSKELASTGAVSTNVGGVQLSSTGVISAPDNIPQTIKDNQSAAQQSQAAATSGQAAVGSTTQQQQASKNSPNLSALLNVINQTQAADKAAQSLAVQNASRALAASVAQSQEQAMSTLATLNAMSAASVQAAPDTSSTPQVSMRPISQSTSVVQLQAPAAPSTLQSLMSVVRQSNETTVLQTQSQPTYQPPVNNDSASAPVTTYQPVASLTMPTLTVQDQITTYQEPVNKLSQFALIAPTTRVYLGQMADTQPVTSSIPLPTFTNTEPTNFTFRSETKTVESDVPAITIASMSRGTSVTEMAETRANIETALNESSTETVKKNVQPNDLAGGVDIAALATQPKGFDVYASTILKDGAFYAPKDIYGNQKTIDNARALRQMSSDRLHQELIDLQYRR